FEIRKAYSSQSFIRKKAVKRSRAYDRNFGKTDPPVTAAEDVLITAESVHNIRVEAPWGSQAEWLVEKVVIGNPEMSVMAAPTTLVNSITPYLPIANASKRPWYVRKGDIVGYLKDPAAYADKPKSDEEWAKYTASAEAIKSVIEGSLKARDLADATATVPTDDKLDDDDNWGPKTTALPDDEPLKGDVADLVNLGPDIPEDVKPKLIEVLRKNRRAFGLDGRLGQVDAKVDVPLKPGAQPVSVP
ncbi:hypothetical protein DXG01_015204, partial [Tephrocybe rancida]